MNSCFQKAELEIVEFLSLKPEPRVTITGRGGDIKHGINLPEHTTSHGIHFTPEQFGVYI